MLRAFSGPFRVAITLWPFVSALLTVPVLALIYHRRGKLTFTSLVWSYLAVLYALGLGCFTLYPMPEGTTGLGLTYGIAPQLHPFAFIGDLQREGMKEVFQLVANIVLFVPLGFMLGRGLQWRWPKVLVAGFLVSLLIETAQLTGFFGLYPYAYRTFDVDDLMTNTLGALVGWGCAQLVNHIRPKAAYEPPAISHSPSFVRRWIAAFIDFGLCGLCAFIAVALYGVVLLVLEHFGQIDPAGFHLQVAFKGHEITGTIPLAQLDDLAWIVFWASLVVFELLVPLTHGGSTLGGSFVRMSCETKQRQGCLRVLFYGLRLFVFWCVFTPAVINGGFGLVPLICLVAYPFCSGMPYDLLPGARYSKGIL